MENEEKSIKKVENFSDSQENFVSLQKNMGGSNYDTEHNRGAEAAADDNDHGLWEERLGIRSVEINGRASLDNRWDTLVYEEGLKSESPDSQLGGTRAAVFSESDRLIKVAKKVGDYIPSTIWDSFGLRNTSPSGESVVFLDDKNNRVIKFKDPFAYVSLKNNNPYSALYEHHIHNHFFGDVGYRFLGVSQDPVSGGVRFVFEQPFIDTVTKPSREEIDKWFDKRGFKLSEDGFWYSDGYVSFTDVWGDNCIKDTDGELHFIDPIIKFDIEPKKVLNYYIEKTNDLKDQLDKAGIGVGSRFKIDRLCSDNDRELISIDFGKEEATFREYNHSVYHDGKPFTWPLTGKSGLLNEIKMNRPYRWIQIDKNRQDLVLSEAKKAVMDRVKDQSSHPVFSEEQIKSLNRYTTLFPDSTSKENIFLNLIDSMKNDFDDEKVYPEWVDDAREEIKDLSHGAYRSENLSRGY